MSKIKVARPPKGIVTQKQRLPRRDQEPRLLPPGGIPAGFISIREAARRLRRDYRTVQRWIDRGWLQVVLLGHSVLVRERTVEWWLKPRLYIPRRGGPPWLRQFRRWKAPQAGPPTPAQPQVNEPGPPQGALAEAAPSGEAR